MFTFLFILWMTFCIGTHLILKYIYDPIVKESQRYEDQEYQRKVASGYFTTKTH